MIGDNPFWLSPETYLARASNQYVHYHFYHLSNEAPHQKLELIHEFKCHNELICQGYKCLIAIGSNSNPEVDRTSPRSANPMEYSSDIPDFAALKRYMRNGQHYLEQMYKSPFKSCK